MLAPNRARSRVSPETPRARLSPPPLPPATPGIAPGVVRGLPVEAGAATERLRGETRLFFVRWGLIVFGFVRICLTGRVGPSVVLT